MLQSRGMNIGNRPLSPKVVLLAFVLLLSASLGLLAAPFLEFRVVVGEHPGVSPPNAERLDLVRTNANGTRSGEAFWVDKRVLISEKDLACASVSTNTLGRPVIAISFTPAGRACFAQVTRTSIDRKLAIVIGGHIVSAPLIKAEISGGNAVIDGNFTESEAVDLARKITDAIAGRKP